MHLDSVDLGDCRGWLGRLPEDSVDLVMTSPPYWSPRSYATSLECIWNDNADCQHEWSLGGNCINCEAWKGDLGSEPTRKMYVDHLLEISRLVKRVLKPSGSFYLNLGTIAAATLRRRSDKNGGTPSQVMNGMLDDGWVLIDKSSWQKPDLLSSEKNRAKHSYELLFHFVKNMKTLLWRNAETGEWVEKKPTQRYRSIKTGVNESWQHLRITIPAIMKAPTNNVTQRKLEMQRLRKQVWHPFAYYYDLDAIRGLQGNRKPAGFEIQEENVQKGRIEGPQFEAFSEEFCLRPILSSCPPKGIVADPFAGSGTTLLVAKKLGRHYLGCDLNSDYVKIARRRLAAAKRFWVA